MAADLVVRHLGRVRYERAWRAMAGFTERRGADTVDEFWCLEHPPVLTLGRAARREHVLNAEDIPLVQVDRGGQVTYHGPGQIVLYTLIDLRRRGVGVRGLVDAIEQAVIDLLAGYGVDAASRADAPGVYVGRRKIAALGLRVRRGASFHGLALNVDMDLEPFRRIDPCGYPGLEVTQVRDQGIMAGQRDLAAGLIRHLAVRLAYRRPVTGEPRMPDVEHPPREPS